VISLADFNFKSWNTILSRWNKIIHEQTGEQDFVALSLDRHRKRNFLVSGHGMDDEG